MARIPLLEEADLPPESQDAVRRIVATRGRLLNVFKALANSPEALVSVAQLGEFARFNTSLAPDLRELAILEVAREHRCAYEWAQHWQAAMAIGVSVEVLSKVGTAELAKEQGLTGDVVRFVRHMLREDGMPDAILEALTESLGAAGLVDLIVLVGYYSLLAKVINVLDVELDPDVANPPVTVDDGQAFQ